MFKQYQRPYWATSQISSKFIQIDECFYANSAMNHLDFLAEYLEHKSFWEPFGRSPKFEVYSPLENFYLGSRLFPEVIPLFMYFKILYY